MGSNTIWPSNLYFSYSQFMVFDSAVNAPGCAWTPSHSAQGFARRESTACFSTLFEYGSAVVSASIGSYVANKGYERVIAVPFLSVSSRVIVEGPEEFDTGRFIVLRPGNYRLVVAQHAIADEEQRIDIFFERLEKPLQLSEVILADEFLKPLSPLLETADIAE